MKRNYFLAVVVLAACFAGTVYVSGGLLRTYLDIPSILIMVLFPFVYQCLIFGASGLKTAFTAAFRENATGEQLANAQLFFKNYGKIIWLSAFVTVLIGAIAILAHLEDPKMLGPNFAIALISALYGGLLHIMIIVPNSVFLKKRLIELSIDI
jgi:flagellar motor component MotA